MSRSLRRRLGLRVCAGCILLTPIAALAHDYWITPETFSPPAPMLLEAALTSGHSYFSNEVLPDITRLRVFAVQPDGREVELPVQRVTSDHALLLAPVTAPGTYILGAYSTKPEYWSRTAEGYRPGRATAVPGAVSTSQYVKGMKTFLAFGEPTPIWRQPLGHPIELVPQADPTAQRAGDRLPVQLLFRGEPAVGAEVLAVYEGFEGDREREVAVETKTDEQGLAEVPLDRPGRWLTYARIDRPAPPVSGLARENYRAYILIEVGAAEGGR